ncbi:MAG: DUF4469 domain-containing protein [Treponema sp.]|jgi:hypothetical protein|nr:DUF4469 domain-containing protein [Treponema sp.]
MLEYTLEENQLTEEAGDYRAQVVNVTSFTSGELADRIMKIGAGLTRSDIASVLEAAKQVIADIIAEGGAVNFELFNAHPSIQGVFGGPDEAFDPAKHKVRINLHPGVALRSAVNDIKLKRVAAVLTGTVITSVVDVKSGAVNAKLTPGRDVKIAGAKLKIAGEDPSVGLYFVPAMGSPVKVDPTDIVVNNPSELIALIPALPAGAWRVRIVTQYSGSNALKTPHTFTFDKELTVG